MGRTHGLVLGVFAVWGEMVPGKQSAVGRSTNVQGLLARHDHPIQSHHHGPTANLAAWKERAGSHPVLFYCCLSIGYYVAKAWEVPVTSQRCNCDDTDEGTTHYW